MTITGNIKFFELSKALSKNGASAVATSGNSAAGNVLDFNKITRWQSVGSDDTTTETLTITFPASVDITRLLILNHNWKSYTIKAVIDTNLLDNDGNDIQDNNSQSIEDDGAGVLDFQDVISITNSTPVTLISETGYSLSSSYYEFASMYTDEIVITITEAQALHDEIDQEKYCFMVIPTIEVNENQGTFEYYPALQDLRDFQSINNRVMNGLYSIEKQLEIFTATLTVKLGISDQDVELFEFLRYTDDDFLIWPCGGKESGYFRFDTRPFRLQDIYQAQAMNAGMLAYLLDIYSNPVAAQMTIRETV